MKTQHGILQMKQKSHSISFKKPDKITQGCSMILLDKNTLYALLYYLQIKEEYTRKTVD